jgi:hypothetical protein
MKFRVIQYSIYTCLGILICYVLLRSFLYVIREPVWGVLDETAHMDYIEKLSNGKFIFNTDSLVEKSIFESLVYTRWGKPKEFDGSVYSAGIAALSYELHQPPLYYLIMTVPNLIMMHSGFSLVQRVMALRLLSWLIFLVALFIGFLSMNNLLKKLGFKSTILPAMIYVLFLTLLGSIGRYSVSNDWLPLLFVNTIIYLLTKLYFHNDKKIIGYLHITIAGLCLIKQTYLPLAIIFFFIASIIEVSFYKSAFYYITYIPVLLWYTMFFYQWHEIKISKAIFNLILPAGMVDFKTFMLILLSNAFNWKAILPFSFTPQLWIFSLFFITLFAVIYFNKSGFIFFIVMIVLFILIIMMYVLNKWIGGVHWYSYRHFNGYGFFIFMGAFGWLIYVFDWIKLYIQRIIS